MVLVLWVVRLFVMVDRSVVFGVNASLIPSISLTTVGIINLTSAVTKVELSTHKVVHHR